MPPPPVAGYWPRLPQDVLDTLTQECEEYGLPMDDYVAFVLIAAVRNAVRQDRHVIGSLYERIDWKRVKGE